MKIKIQLNSPEFVLEKVKTYFTTERKKIIILTFIFAIVTHFLLLSNMIMSQDGLFMGVHYTAGSYEASLGRWGIDILDSIRNNIAIPFVTTIISIIIMCFINILLIELLEIKSNIFKFFTILSVVASPGLCMTLLYVYTADVYLFAMLFSVLSVYSLYKIKSNKIGIVLSMIFFILTLSVYQSYIGITVGLVLIISIKKLLSQENNFLEIIKDIVQKALIIMLSALLYWLLTKIILFVNGIQMAGYGGLNNISVSTILSTLIPSIKKAYISFIKYFFADGIILNRSWKRDKLYLFFFAVFAICMLAVLLSGLKKENRKDFLRNYTLTCLIITLLPIALNIVIIIAPGNDIYYLTSTQMILMFPLLFVIFELLTTKDIIKNLLNWGISIISSLILFTYIMCCIVTYQTLEFSFDQAKNIANRILEEMEECEGYETDMPVMFAGVVADGNFVKTLDLYNYAINNSLRGSIFHGTYLGQQNTWRNFYNIFLGKQLYFCEDYQYYNIVNSDKFKTMNVFPGNNSVRIIDGVMVVKFTDEPELPPWSQNMMLHGINAY